MDDLNPDTDPMKPPPTSILVHCIHCGEEYDSYRIEWRVSTGPDGRPQGFWCCPIEGCDGIGFGFDIFPVDPEEGEKYGIFMSDDGDDEEEYDEDDAADFLDDDEDDDYEDDDGADDAGGNGNGEHPPGPNGPPPGDIPFDEDDVPF